MGAAAEVFMAGRVEDPDSLDYFPSPPWWGRAAGEVLARLGLATPADLRRQSVEEPACGEGHLAHGLAEVFGQVRASDVHDYGRGFPVRDYLGRGGRDGAPDWTVTNPPFGDLTSAFIRRATARSRRGAVMFLQLRLLEGPGRHALFGECGLYATAVLPRKGSGLRKGLWQPNLSTKTAYAMFVFVRPGLAPGWAGFEGEARQLWLEPEIAARLTRPSDAAFAGVLGAGVPGRAGA